MKSLPFSFYYYDIIVMLFDIKYREKLKIVSFCFSLNKMRAAISYQVD